MSIKASELPKDFIFHDKPIVKSYTVNDYRQFRTSIHKENENFVGGDEYFPIKKGEKIEIGDQYFFNGGWYDNFGSQCLQFSSCKWRRKVEAGYYILRENQVIEPTDEVFYNGGWISTRAFGGKVHSGGIYRRKKIIFPKKDTKNNEDEHRILEAGEKIEIGDECYLGGKWEKASCIGDIALGGFATQYRRKKIKEKGYQFLMEGKNTSLGDERLVGNKWTPCAKGILITKNLQGHFRRRKSETYYFLKHGDTIYQGDEFFTENEEWAETHLYGNIFHDKSHYQRYRRKL